MSLPKIDHPTFELTVPSTKESIRYRPFLVREEKILLMAEKVVSRTTLLMQLLKY